MAKPVGKVNNYLVEMHDRKKQRVLHVSMLQEWHLPAQPALLGQTAMEEMSFPPGTLLVGAWVVT